MKESRKITIAGEINMESYISFSKRLSLLERKSTSLPVEIELCSEGGEVYSALAFRGRIRTSPCHVTVTAFGLVASAAVIILTSADRRKMASEAWCMVHEDSEEITGTVTFIEEAAERARRLEEQWAELMALDTRTPIEKWRELHKTDTYLNAEECLLAGIVDEVV